MAITIVDSELEDGLVGLVSAQPSKTDKKNLAIALLRAAKNDREFLRRHGFAIPDVVHAKVKR